MPPYESRAEKAPASDQANDPNSALHKDTQDKTQSTSQAYADKAAATRKLEAQGVLPVVDLNQYRDAKLSGDPVPQPQPVMDGAVAGIGAVVGGFVNSHGGDTGSGQSGSGSGSSSGGDAGESQVGAAKSERPSTINSADDGHVVRDTKGGLLDYMAYGDGHARTFQRDDKGNLTGVYNADGSSWVNDNGTWRHKDADGHETENSGYGPRVFADGSFQIAESDGTVYTGKPDGTMEAKRGDGSTVEYNSAGQATRVEYKGGATRSFEYDRDGNLTTMTDVNGKKWTADSSGHWTQPDGTPTDAKVTVDSAGNMSIGYDGGNQNEYLTNGASLEKNGQGEVTAVHYGDGKSRSFEYGQDGKISKITETDGNTWTKGDDNKWHEYGKDGKATGHTNDATPSVDENGNYTIKNADGSSQLRKSDGSTVDADKDGRVDEIDYPDGKNRKFGYNDKGELTAMADSDGNITTRDDKGNWHQFNKDDPLDIHDAKPIIQVFGDGTIRGWDGGDILTSTDNVTSHPNPGHNLWGEHSDNPLDAITPDAVHQGGLGDCYFLAAVAAEAKANPQAIQNMIKDNGNGTYTVTFPGDPDHPVTVDAPTEQELGSYAHDDGKNGMWVNVLEKAHRKYTGRENSDDGDDTDAGIKLLSPKGSQNEVDDDLSGGWFGIGRTDEGNVKKDIINGLKDHKMIVAGTADGDWLDHLGTTNDPGNYVNNHVWAITGFDEKTNMITMRNPWGGDGGDNGTFTISLDDFYNKFQDMAFANS